MENLLAGGKPGNHQGHEVVRPSPAHSFSRAKIPSVAILSDRERGMSERESKDPMNLFLPALPQEVSAMNRNCEQAQFGNGLIQWNRLRTESSLKFPDASMPTWSGGILRLRSRSFLTPAQLRMTISLSDVLTPEGFHRMSPSALPFTSASLPSSA